MVIPKGSQDGDRIVFSKQGHEAAAVDSSSLVFIVREKAHPVFTRKGDDLFLVCTVTLKEALTSAPITIRTIQARVIAINFDEVVSPRTRTLLNGEGMPRRQGPERGDLHVSFRVVFPREMSF